MKADKAMKAKEPSSRELGWENGWAEFRARIFLWWVSDSLKGVVSHTNRWILHWSNILGQPGKTIICVGVFHYPVAPTTFLSMGD